MKNARPTEVKPSALDDALTSAFIVLINTSINQQTFNMLALMLIDARGVLL